MASAAGPTRGSCRLEVFDPAGHKLVTTRTPLTRSDTALVGRATLPVMGSAQRRGLYRIEATLDSAEAVHAPQARTGFYLEPAPRLKAASLTVEGRLLERNGQPFPVTGMNYMASDVHRRFLLEPNPVVWDADLAAMKRWGGVNAYLDPRSLAAQSRFVSTIAQRFAGEPRLVWDLVNEPSFCSPDHLWYCRPNYDRHEAAAWDAWLRERYPFPSDAEREAHLQELWRSRPGDSLGLPRVEEFTDRRIFEEHRPLKATEYRLFAQQMFRGWVQAMRSVIRAAGATQLVMVGQDEGGTYERPSNAFFGDLVDLTSLHSWWFNDDLLWAGLVTQHPQRPNLVQEAGVMFAEGIDGTAWRSEEEAHQLVERKLALAVGATGAGGLLWIWNTNPYLPSDNEAAIGVLRPDGSAKPDLSSFEGIAAFARAAAPLLREREPAPALMVVAHSNLLSVRNTTTDATRRAVRATHYHCRITMDAVSEYALAEVREPPRLVVLPAPRTLCDSAWERLLRWAEGGTTVVASGPLDLDDHWLPAPRLARLGLGHRIAPVAPAEHLTIGGMEHLLAFRGERTERVEKAVVAGEPRAELARIEVGRGVLLWAPIPVELAEDVEPTAAVYATGVQVAGIERSFSAEGLDASVLVYPAFYRRAVLYTLISEASRATAVRLIHAETNTPIELSLPAQRAALLLLDRPSGAVLARY